MKSVMQKIYTPRVAPIFTTNDENALPAGTHSFLEARKWLENGYKVFVSFKGEHIGEMRMGKPIEKPDDIYNLNPNEPYGTVHYAKAQHCFYINLPDELLESAGV